MEPRDVVKIVGPVLTELAEQLRAEIKQARDFDCDEIAVKVAELVDAFAAKRFKELDERLKVIERYRAMGHVNHHEADYDW